MNAGEVVILSTAEWVVAVSVIGGICIGWIHGYSSGKNRVAKIPKSSVPKPPEIKDDAAGMMLGDAAILPEGIVPKVSDVQFSVAGTPRPVPWHLRKRELEAASRTKRKARDEYREMA